MKVLENLFSKGYISVGIFVLTLLLSVLLKFLKHNKRRQFVTPGKILFVGIFASAFTCFMPLYLNLKLNWFQSILSSFQHSFRIFGLDGDFLEFVANQEYPDDTSKEFYKNYAALLYAVAPLMTFGFILTFFKNFFAHLKYKVCFWTKVHAFSELNEKSLALAKSLLKKNKPYLGFVPKILIVFTDVIDKKEELSLDLIEESREIGALLFRKDLESVRFKRSWSLRKVDFYLISEDESEKIRHTESIIKNYDYNGVKLWIFSDDIRTELMLAKNQAKKMKATRVNDIQALIYHNIDQYGFNLFKRARKIDDKTSVISVVIIGLGKYGCEMLKALTWYCQLAGYKLKINVFDADEKAKEKFVAMCPELMSDEYNKKEKDGEPYYEIDIHPGVDVEVSDFKDKLAEIDDATYIFVCLGDDEINLGVATKVRSICECINYKYDGRKPDIETIIYDSNVRKNLGITWGNADNSGKEKQGAIYKKSPYNILMTGDLEYFYSDETVINSELYEAGFAIHKGYCVEPSRISFAEKKMEVEWEKFIAEENIEAEWKAYYSQFEENDKIEFSEAKEGFSFMTNEEKGQELKSTDSDKLKELKRKVTERIDKWEKRVYEKFQELMKDDELAEEWEKLECDSVSDAADSFRLEYNYRSSISKAMHKRLRQKLNFRPEITAKTWENLTSDEKIELGKIEHVRWNAYMRTEGYSYCKDRNDLAKQHPNLVPVEELKYNDLRKDA